MKTLFLSLILFVSLAASAQPFYGNIVPADSGTQDIGRTHLHWDTIYVNNIVPTPSGAGIWAKTNDSTIRWSFGGDTVFFYINNGVVRLGSDAALHFGVKGNNPYIFNGTTATAAELRLNEDTDNGTNYAAWKALANLAGSYTLLLPSTDGNTGEVLGLSDNSGTTTWITPATISPFTSDGGSDVFLRDSTDNVGIGTSQPTAKLHIRQPAGVGAILDLGTAGDSAYYAFAPDAFQIISNGFGVRFGRVDTDAGSRMVLQAENPQDTLRLVGGATFGSVILSVKDAGLYPDDLFILNNDGNVGIGAATPSKKLEVNGDVLISDTLFTTSISIADTLAGDAEAATLLNFPTGTAGNPTGFVNVLINGVIRKMPYW